MTSIFSEFVNSFLPMASEQVQQVLAEFARRGDALKQLGLAFGDGFDRNAAESLLAAWGSGDFSLIPEIEVVSAEDLSGANGGYAVDKNRIYVAREFVSTQSLPQVANLLVEEIGHGVDRLINKTDSPGDEGAIFAALVFKNGLSLESLARLKVENDLAVVEINGEYIAVEQQNLTGTAGNDVINGTEQDDTISGLAGDDQLNGLGGNDVKYLCKINCIF